jgi:hypothetical protein
MKQLTEFAGVDHSACLFHRGLESAFMTNAQHCAGSVAR